MADSTAAHGSHDVEAIAALAAGDPGGVDALPALRLVAACSDCAELHADLLAIAAMLPTVPPPIGSAGRDFRLTDADAARLRRGSGIRRFLRPFAGPSFAFARALGSATAAIGLAAVLVSGSGLVPGDRLGGSPYTETSTDGRDLFASPVPILGPAASAGAEVVVPTAKVTAPEPPAVPAPPDPFLAGGWLLIATGLLLIAIRGLARRVSGR